MQLIIYVTFTLYYWSAVAEFDYLVHRLLRVAVRESGRSARDDVPLVLAERSVLEDVQHLADARRVARQRD